jgi:hypothetical protein
MKRSDVVNKIESLLNSVDGDKVRISNKLLADLLLNTVDEMGMLPPTHVVIPFAMGLNTRVENKWERE